MQWEKSKELICKVIFYISVAGSTCGFFILLGAFYKAIDHSIGLNIVVWVSTIVLSHSFVYLIRWLFNLFRKRKIIHAYIDGISFACGSGIVAIICAFSTKNIDDYLYTTVMGSISAIASTIQIILAIRKRDNSK